MCVPEYKHIAVRPEIKEQLAERKPEGVTWGRFLHQEILTNE